MLDTQTHTESYNSLFVIRRKKLSWILFFLLLSIIGSIREFYFFSNQPKLIGILVLFFLLDICTFALLCYARYYWNYYERSVKVICSCAIIEFFLKLVILLIPYTFVTENYIVLIYGIFSTYFPYIFLTFSIKNRLENLYISLQNPLYDKIRNCFIFVYLPFQFIIYGIAINIDSVYNTITETAPNPNPILYLMFLLSIISIPFYKYKNAIIIEIVWSILAVILLYRYNQIQIIGNVISALISALKINLIIQDCIFYIFEENFLKENRGKEEYILQTLVSEGSV